MADKDEDEKPVVRGCPRCHHVGCLGTCGSCPSCS
jgi:hypothetical protein